MLRFVRRNLKQAHEILRAAEAGIEKQGIRVQGRIVSIYKDFIRPISRGKIPVPVEFDSESQRSILIGQLSFWFKLFCKLTFASILKQQNLTSKKPITSNKTTSKSSVALW